MSIVIFLIGKQGASEALFDIFRLKAKRTHDGKIITHVIAYIIGIVLSAKMKNNER